MKVRYMAATMSFRFKVKIIKENELDLCSLKYTCMMKDNILNIVITATMNFIMTLSSLPGIRSEHVEYTGLLQLHVV